MLILFITLAVVCIAALSIAQVRRPVHNLPAYHHDQRTHFKNPSRGTLDRNHVDVVGDRIIKHQEAEPGYVILNGVKRRIEDCKEL